MLTPPPIYVVVLSLRSSSWFTDYEVFRFADRFATVIVTLNPNTFCDPLAVPPCRDRYITTLAINALAYPFGFWYHLYRVCSSCIRCQRSGKIDKYERESHYSCNCNAEKFFHRDPLSEIFNKPSHVIVSRCDPGHSNPAY
jgi:hypothetical protein